MHVNQTHLHTCTLRVIPLVTLQKNGHVMHVGYLSKKQSKKQDHSPSMTLSNVAFQNDPSPSKRIAKIFHNIAIMAIR